LNWHNVWLASNPSTPAITGSESDSLARCRGARNSDPRAFSLGAGFVKRFGYFWDKIEEIF